MNVFIDTNVLLDALLQREPHLRAAAEIWSLVDAGKVAGYVSAISLNNAYYLIRRQENRATAREAMRLMMRAFSVVPLDESVIEKSTRAAIDDFEDAIQYYSALAVRARYLVTRDSAHFPKRGVEIVSPEHFLAIAFGDSKN